MSYSVGNSLTKHYSFVYSHRTLSAYLRFLRKLKQVYKILILGAWGLCMHACMWLPVHFFQLLNQLADLQEMWNGCYAVGAHHSLIVLIFLESVVTTLG
jgi:hypothetical protein